MAAKGLAPIRVPEVGLNNVGSYQVSGRPFVSTQQAYAGAEVAFPVVSQWVQVTNRSIYPVRVGFSAVGISGSHHLVLSGASETFGGNPATTGELRVKVSGIWIYSPSGSAHVDVVAGLTCIDRKKTAGRLGPNWSGSAGVG
tara:strand:- start:4 stop:429 length:426 start_codon:yes stop_codon:yes gene_type:complete